MQGVMEATQQFYAKFMAEDAIHANFSVVSSGSGCGRVGGAGLRRAAAQPAEHSWPTNNFGNDCGTLGSPYINNWCVG
jgi:hypothetical protein